MEANVIAKPADGFRLAGSKGDVSYYRRCCWCAEYVKVSKEQYDSPRPAICRECNEDRQRG